MVDTHYSYPSGHASLSFSNLSVVFWYIVGKTGALREAEQGSSRGGRGWKLMLAVIAFLGLAGFSAMTRVVDYKHHPSDINAGAAIGMTMGTLFYLANFASPLVSGAPLH